MSDRDLDLVLHGATGFVGRLVAEYLAGHAPDGLRIGLSGRDVGRLSAVRDALGARAAGWPLLVADNADADALAALAARTRVVATTVGPYLRYGLPLARACAAAGTHYADLTGEVLFVRQCIDELDAPARASGARIVNACGFDSIPSDLAVALLHERARADGDGELGDTTLVARFKGGLSGGTIDSMRAQLEAIGAEPERRDTVTDPYALSPDRGHEPELGDERERFDVFRSDDFGGWVGPFVMAGFNTRVVRRSNALQGWAYGRRFRYRELAGYGDGVKAQATATAVTTAMGATLKALGSELLSGIVDKALPAPGEGPSAEQRAAGHFEMQVHTTTAGGRRYLATVAAQGDPGYAATSVMLGEAALALALDDLPDAAGVLTPATGIGLALADRLRAQGFTLSVKPTPGLS